MATESAPSVPPRRTLLIAVAVVAVVVAVVLVVVSQLTSDDKPSGEDRAAAVTQGATADTTAGAATAAASTAAGATTVASTLPYIEDVQALLADVPQDGTILGNANAPVTVTEYADLRCPACRAWETQELETLLDGPVKSGDAKLDLQILSILGEDSDRAALGGWAAEAQNKLFPFAMLWYYNQGPESEDYATDDYQRAVAAGAGLDVTKFDQDRASDATQQQAEKTLAKAQEAGFTGTPAFIVTGPGGTFPFVNGQVPTAQTLIDTIAKAKGA